MLMHKNGGGEKFAKNGGGERKFSIKGIVKKLLAVRCCSLLICLRLIIAGAREQSLIRTGEIGDNIIIRDFDQFVRLLSNYADSVNSQ